MISNAITFLIALAGLINALPVIGMVSARRIERLYAVEMDRPDIAILMRHRAALFGLLGGFMIYAAFDPALWLAACVIGLVSMASFIVLAWMTGGYNVALRKVVWIDIAGIVPILVALVLMTV